MPAYFAKARNFPRPFTGRAWSDAKLRLAYEAALLPLCLRGHIG
jgi:hypothetical protein